MTAPEPILLTRAEVEKLIGLSRSRIYSLVKLGQFPLPVKLGTGPRGAVRWHKAEILTWIESRQRADLVRPDLEPYRAA
ncbi:MAG: AlpA family phage regulatory protein [Gammaproteobacteria bacterium]|nr:AlpA family phage regulatory protein [Gammaproteobacteria bacterium]MDE0510436.1 AlpA family phage regulatory protein [Gammaproteobacteria bacterium]